MANTITEEKNTFGALRAAREYKNYVDGQWVASSSSKKVKPALGPLLTRTSA